MPKLSDESLKPLSNLIKGRASSEILRVLEVRSEPYDTWTLNSFHMPFTSSLVDIMVETEQFINVTAVAFHRNLLNLK